MVSLLALGCEPSLHVGDLECSPAQAGASAMNANGVFNEGPLPVPWQTSFEDGFCGYQYRAGFCYAEPGSSFRLVTSPVHSGPFAAAFEFHASDTGGTRQARCVREGVLADEAYYGAWYYVPSGIAAARDFNLLHFQGGTAGERLHGLWDVSIDDRHGELAPYMFDLLHGRRYEPTDPQPIPLDRWFQLELYLKRAADSTGEVALFQDGVEVTRATNVITDDAPFSQWYVGSFAQDVAPTLSPLSLYVDDVTIRVP
jgi:hypothetical protein